MLEPFLRPRMTDFGLAAGARLLYKSHGLTILGAVVTFAAFVLFTGGWRPLRSRAAARIAASDPRRQATIRGLGLLLLILFLLALPEIAGSFLSQVLVFVGLYMLLGLGLNIVVGYAGLLDLGYVAFYAVGAYSPRSSPRPLSSFGLGPAVLGGAAGRDPRGGADRPVHRRAGAAPAGRLPGDRDPGLRRDRPHPLPLRRLKPWLGGAQGILGVPPLLGTSQLTIPILGWQLSGPTLTYYPILFFCVVAAFVARRLKYSRTGRAWNAMREDEDVARGDGVNIVNYKLLAFALGASVGCLGGAIFATHLGSVYPGTFDVLVSITVLSIIILGGMGSIPGVVIGALVLVGLPELLREFAEFRLLVYGGVLVVMMIAPTRRAPPRRDPAPRAPRGGAPRAGGRRAAPRPAEGG